MEPLANLAGSIAAVSRDPGLGHDLRYGSILLVTIALETVWLIRTWRNAPDPEERWHRTRDEEDESDGARTRRNAGR
jgi:hypothetical protein